MIMKNLLRSALLVLVVFDFSCESEMLASDTPKVILESCNGNRAYYNWK